MIEERLTSSQWIQLPQDIRNKLVELFNIPRTGYIDVRNMQVVSDGYTDNDLKTITVDKLKAYTGLEVGSIYELLTQAIIKIQTPLEVNQTNDNAKTTTSTQDQGTVSVRSEPKKGRGKKGTNNKGKDISISSK